MPDRQIPWWRTDLGDAEIAAVARAIREHHINQGPVCEELERRLAELLDVPHVVTVANGSQAILAALLACGVGPGDEVIVPACTFIAGANAAALLGAKVRLVDVCRDRPVIDAGQAEAAVTGHTKVILAVHLNGRACDVAALNEIAARHGVKVLEDSAQAFCSRNDRGCLGTQADLGTFSMGLTKLITTGEGGFVAVRDEAMYTRLLRLRNQGVLRGENTFAEPGLNFKLTDVQAAIGLAQVARLDERIAAVTRVYRFYEERLADLDHVRLINVRVDGGELPLWAEVICSERERVAAALLESGIRTTPYPPCLAESEHLSAAGEFPNARAFCERGLVLPCGTHQPEEDLRRVADALHQIVPEIER